MRLLNVSFSYGNKKIINNISIDFTKTKQIYLIKGANGSGKTTLLKIICGLIRGYKGTLENSQYRIIRGSLDFLGFDDSKTGYKNIELFNKIDHHLESFNELLEKFSMTEDIHLKISKMSAGMKMKISLIDALLPTAALTVLDEPFNGLDKKSQISLIEIIMSRIKKDCSFILTSHYDSIVEKHLEAYTIITL